MSPMAINMTALRRPQTGGFLRKQNTAFRFKKKMIQVCLYNRPLHTWLITTVFYEATTDYNLAKMNPTKTARVRVWGN